VPLSSFSKEAASFALLFFNPQILAESLSLLFYSILLPYVQKMK